MQRESSGKRDTIRFPSGLRKLALGAALSVGLSACAFVQSSTISATTGSGTPVTATDSDYGILRLTVPRELVSDTGADLAKQCPSGLLTDVQTQLSMRDWLLIVQSYSVTANAVCKPPPPAPPAPPAPPVPPVPPMVLRGVHFGFNRYNITPASAATLDEAAAALKAHPDVTVDVNGYCDSIGSVPYNLRLSEKRADAVVDYLKKDGVTNNLVPHGYGKTDFVASNATAEGRAQNRRVELVPEH